MKMEKQATNRVIMIRPANFGVNPDTAASNIFQDKAAIGDPVEIAREALREFDEFANLLRSKGVEVRVFDDIEFPAKPDAVFPNNWISTHANGSVVLYPMQAQNRRYERRLDILDTLIGEDGFHVDRLIDFSAREAHNRFLEGTGSLVLDRINRVAYACLSARTDRDMVDEWADEMGYQAYVFEATTGPMEQAIYHTNVVMCLGTEIAVAGFECFRNSSDAERVRNALLESGREIIDISQDQVFAFAGNMLELANAKNEPLLVMSETAHANLAPSQREKLAGKLELVVADIRTIERCAGGSVRCMIAENFLPRHNEV